MRLCCIAIPLTEVAFILLLECVQFGPILADREANGYRNRKLHDNLLKSYTYGVLRKIVYQYV